MFAMNSGIIAIQNHLQSKKIKIKVKEAFTNSPDFFILFYSVLSNCLNSTLD